MENTKTRAANWFALWIGLLMAATLALNLISAYIRLNEAGVGCEPWPSCYARIGQHLEPVPPTPVETLAPVERIKQAHRAFASALVVIVLIIVAQARSRPLAGTARFLPYAIAFVVLLLSVVGPASYLKTMPAVATVNLIGGMALLALSGLLWLAARPLPLARYPELWVMARLSLVVLIIQLLLGAWVSANFAAAACTGLLDCSASGGDLSAFWYLRELALDPSGQIVVDGSQALIQMSHHVWAFVVSGMLGVLAWRCLAAGARRWGALLLAGLCVQLLLGVAGVALQLPLPIVLLHSITGSLLLLVVVWIVYLSRRGRTTR